MLDAVVVTVLIIAWEPPAIAEDVAVIVIVLWAAL